MRENIKKDGIMATENLKWRTVSSMKDNLSKDSSTAKEDSFIPTYFLHNKGRLL